MELALASRLRGDERHEHAINIGAPRVDEIGLYQILEDLGPAPFGMAYLALDSRTDQRILLKMIPPSRPGLQQEETPWDVLLKETRALLRIPSPGIRCSRYWRAPPSPTRRRGSATPESDGSCRSTPA
jgi:hypothetical protein